MRRQQVPEQGRRHALAGLDAAEHHHRGVRHDLASGQRGGGTREHTFPMVDRPADVPVEGGDGLGRPVADLATGRHPIDGRDDLVVPAEHDRGLDVEELQRGRHDTDGQRAGDVAPDLGSTAAGRRSSTSARASSRTRSPNRSITCGRRNAAANGSRWRRCSSPSSESMLGPTTCAVEKRGSSTVNRCASRMTSMHRSRRVTSHPSRTGTQDDGLALAERCEGRIGVASSSASVIAAPRPPRSPMRRHAPSMYAQSRSACSREPILQKRRTFER